MSTAAELAMNNNERSKLLQKHRVFFDLNERQAPGHEDCFDDIKELGNYSVNGYRSNVSIESRKRPWGQTETMLKRVRAISEKARRCCKAKKNESGWRLGLESEILSRFDIEVVCPTCRARLWRAELEVAVTASNQSLEGLDARQKTRQSCMCPSRGLGDDRYDSGLNLLFDDRAEEPIEHDEEIEKILKKSRGKKPDRVIGLRATDRIERILNETSNSDGECIAAFLDLQRNLVEKTTENEQSDMQPLVWYLANKGEDWRVYGAYLESVNNDEMPKYRILELWAGNITYEDKALGLLLIIDYIFDWARDIYRRDIISNLLSLASNPTPSLIAGTDVYSTADYGFNVDRLQDFGSAISSLQKDQFSVQNMLRFFDKPDFALRDARYVHWDFCGLFITEENLTGLLRSARNPREAKQFSRRLWRSILGSQTWVLSAACLSAVEELWTGKSRESETFQNPDEFFLVVFFIRSYLTEGEGTRFMSYRDERPGQWNQHQELTYIAVAENALSSLRSHTEFQPQFSKLHLENYPRVSLDWTLKALRKHCFASTQVCLLRAMSYCTFTSLSVKSHKSIDNTFISHQRFPGAHWDDYFEVSIELPIPLKPQSSLAMGIPWLIYQRLKIGMSEPDETFLRISQHFARQDLSRHNQIHRPHPQEPKINLKGSNAVVVADMTCNAKEPTRLRYCIYVLDVPDIRSETVDGMNPMQILPCALGMQFKSGRERDNCFSKMLRPDIRIRPATDFLEHVSTQYQLFHSIDSAAAPNTLPEWIQRRFEALSSLSVAKWHYTTQQTIDGIKSIGAGKKTGQLLQNLLTPSQIASDSRLAAVWASEIPEPELRPIAQLQNSITTPQPSLTSRIEDESTKSSNFVSREPVERSTSNSKTFSKSNKPGRSSSSGETRISKNRHSIERLIKRREQFMSKWEKRLERRDKQPSRIKKSASASKSVSEKSRSNLPSNDRRVVSEPSRSKQVAGENTSKSSNELYNRWLAQERSRHQKLSVDSSCPPVIDLTESPTSDKRPASSPGPDSDDESVIVRRKRQRYYAGIFENGSLRRDIS